MYFPALSYLGSKIKLYWPLIDNMIKMLFLNKWMKHLLYKSCTLGCDTFMYQSQKGRLAFYTFIYLHLPLNRFDGKPYGSLCKEWPLLRNGSGSSTNHAVQKVAYPPLVIYIFKFIIENSWFELDCLLNCLAERIQSYPSLLESKYFFYPN